MVRKSQPLSALLAKEKPEVLQAAQRQAEDMLLGSPRLAIRAFKTKINLSLNIKNNNQSNV